MKMVRTRSFNLLVAFAALILAFSALASGTDTYEDPELKDPELKQCKHQCRAQQGFGEEEIEECSRRCDWYHDVKMAMEREKGSGEGGGEGQQQEENNPYVFREHHFMARVHTRGRYLFLPKFTQRSPKLFRGIENFRFSVVEAEPRTFIVPSHWDADVVSFVLQGEATMSLVWEDKRESFKIRRGDILQIPSGITRYVVNKDKNQKLIIADLLRPVSNPGEFEAFFPAGNQAPDTYLQAFTPEILAAALNRKTDEVRRIISGTQQQRREAFIEASEEQIQGFSEHGEGGIWPFRGERKGSVINILDKSPTHSNEFGQLHEVDVVDSKGLQDVNVALSYTNITLGGMMGPLYNSRSTLLSFVVSGYGYGEISCPHLASGRGSEEQQQEWGSVHYQKVSLNLSPGVAYIVPPAHPYLLLASKDQNLVIISFKINAIGNERIAVAGKENVIMQFEKPAKELGFGRAVRIVNRVFGNQKEKYFFMGPELWQQGGGGGGGEAGRAEA